MRLVHCCFPGISILGAGSFVACGNSGDEKSLSGDGDGGGDGDGDGDSSDPNVPVGMDPVTVPDPDQKTEDEENNSEEVDWEGRGCEEPDLGTDGEIVVSDGGADAWDESSTVDGDGVVTTDFATMYPVLSPGSTFPLDETAGAIGGWAIRRTNYFRAWEGLEPYERHVEGEPCAGREAKDSVEGGGGHVLDCPGAAAQGLCGGEGDAITGSNFCWKLFAGEAQTQGGHYGGMMRTEPRYMAWGYYRTAEGNHTIMQDYYRDDPPERFEGEDEVFFDDITPPGAGSFVAKSVAAGGNHSCALLDDGDVVCWGDDLWGQLGADGGERATKVPVSANLSAAATQVVAGHVHTCALLEDGTVECFGSNEYTQLGVDEWRGNHRELVDHFELSPKQAINLPADDPVVHLAAAHSSTCAELESGAVHCWGFAMNGVLGRPTSVGDGDAPWSAFGGIIGTESTNLQGVGDFSMGSFHGCGLNDGGAWCWGRDFRGQVGDGTREPLYFAQSTGDGNNVTAHDPTVPHAVVGLQGGVQQVAAGGEHSCAILDNGTVRCWGSNRYAQLGFEGNYDIPESAENEEKAGEFEAEPVDVCLSQPAIDLALGGAHSCALLEDQTVAYWGSSNHGKLGNGYFVNDSPSPSAVEGLSDVTDIDSHYMHTCAVTESGQVYCWGLNYYGQLGDGGKVDQATPSLVTGF